MLSNLYTPFTHRAKQGTGVRHFSVCPNKVKNDGDNFMVPRIDGPLKKPNQPGFMGPLAILKVYEAAQAQVGAEFADDLLRTARIFRLPEKDEPVREAMVVQLHQVLRRDFAEHAVTVLNHAGRLSADFVMDYRMPRNAQAMIERMPWSMGAWILGRSLLQNSWTFSGSGHLSTSNRMEFQLCDATFTWGEASETPLCHYHAALLGRLFQSLVHTDLTCSETQCMAQGHPCCHFKIHVAKSPTSPPVPPKNK